MEEFDGYPKSVWPILNRFDSAWGPSLEVQDSWFPHLVELNEKLSEIVPDYRIHQVKEKFGGLRYYIDDNTEMRRDAQKLIHDYEADSYNW